MFVLFCLCKNTFYSKNFYFVEIYFRNHITKLERIYIDGFNGNNINVMWPKINLTLTLEQFNFNTIGIKNDLI